MSDTEDPLNLAELQAQMAALVQETLVLVYKPGVWSDADSVSLNEKQAQVNYLEQRINFALRYDPAHQPIQ